VPVAHEAAVHGQRLHRHPEGIAALDLGIEVDVPGEDVARSTAISGRPPLSSTAPKRLLWIVPATVSTLTS